MPNATETASPQLTLEVGERFELRHRHGGRSLPILVSATPAEHGTWDVVYTRHGGLDTRLFHEQARLQLACEAGCCLTPAAA